MNRIGIFILALLTTFSPLIANAFDVTGQSRTYLLTREAADSSRLTQAYEYLNLKAESADTGAVSFNVGGWYRYDLQSERDDKHNEDLQYAYLSIKQQVGNGMFNLGRLRAGEGLISELIDGAYAGTDLRAGFGVAIYGGSPVERRDNTRRGDVVYGGRISHSVPGVYQLGVSALEEKDNGEDLRREAGVDLWLHPVSRMDIQGTSSYNDLTNDWMQHAYVLSIGPFGGLRLTGEASRVNYRDFFTASTISAFTFPRINPDETVTATGGAIEYAFLPSLFAVIDYKSFDYRIAGPADYFGGKMGYTGGTFGAGFSLHRMDGESALNQYDEQSLYLTGKSGKADVSLQGIRLGYKQEINGVKNAYNASAALGYAFTPKARAVADVEYAKNPDFNKDIRGMLTFVYLFDMKFESQPKKARSPKRT